jgi:hypothetical protein
MTPRPETLGGMGAVGSDRVKDRHHGFQGAAWPPRGGPAGGGGGLVSACAGDMLSRRCVSRVAGDWPCGRVPTFSRCLGLRGEFGSTWKRVSHPASSTKVGAQVKPTRGSG